MEPFPKWARVQAVPAVYRDMSRIAVLNLADRTVVWKPELIAGTAAPMDPDQDGPQEKVTALRAVHAAQGENLETHSLDQLYITLGLEDNRILRANPFLRTSTYDLIREFQDIFTSLECESEETDLIEFPLEADRRSR